MSVPLSSDVPPQLLSALCRLVQERASVEAHVQAESAADNQAAEEEFQKKQRALTQRYESLKAAAEQKFAATTQALTAEYEKKRGDLEAAHDSARKECLAQFAAEHKAAEQAAYEVRSAAIEGANVARGGIGLPLEEVLAGLDSRWRDLEKIHQNAVELMKTRGHWDDFPVKPVAINQSEHPGRRFFQALEQAQAQYRVLDKQFLPKLFQGFRPLGLLILLWVIVAYPAYVVVGADNTAKWLIVSSIITAVVGVAAYVITYVFAERRSVRAYLALRQTMLEAGLGDPAFLENTKKEFRELEASLIARQEAAIKKSKEELAHAVALIDRRKQHEVRRLEEAYPKKIAQIVAWRDESLGQIQAEHAHRCRKSEEQYAAESRRLQEHRDQIWRETRQRFAREWNTMTERWKTGMERFRLATDYLNETCDGLFPDWNTDDWNRWTPPTTIPPIIRFGQSTIRLADIAGGLSEDKELQPEKLEYALPALLPYPQHSMLMLKAAGPETANAVSAMQSCMFRLLTGLPPGKVRFTIIDPVGLGDNFSEFMHLADFDEQLVANRIWTDSNHIEERLADLTKHMETVIQVYLRKEFNCIEEYNASAGEMAEPYRVLVVANFPANFSETAIQRLKSVISSGARCGVFVMLSVDANLPLPRNFQMSDLKGDALELDWTDGSFVVAHPEYGPLAIQADPPPPAEKTKDILYAVGSKAKEGSRVEVPFTCISPGDSDWWTTDSRAGIDVPLGRAGAMKLQSLSLGSGTSQHVLLSGKTGSGKSTLLHVLVTNLAMRYSPDEVELYLIDFKKGVEFKAYAREHLPHARVIAIESEREFGLSVLQRLDAELRTRGQLFRERGVQDVKTYRAANPDARLPRILLIIDEFQELFTEDDRIAQESTLLLDRLVRQGRAFGIHLLLGSQTLGGAYSLARSTIGQMAVRIALQCSEADAHLILSEDNTAARLLTRPGEAIYNDANGMYEGNHPFQICWLSDTERDGVLRRVDQFAEQRHVATAPPIVFEGSSFADPSGNPCLQQLLDSPTWPELKGVANGWLGSAVAIKDPTAAGFARQPASNLLMVGHREDSAVGVFASCFLSLAAQYRPTAVATDASAASFYILDGTRADSPQVGFWNRLAAVVPQTVKLGNLRTSNELIAEIYAELAARQEASREDAPAIYLVVHNLGRFRDLKKEEDYGFSDGDKGVNPGKQFGEILREGPPLGIHVLVWCDTYSSANRMLDRQGMRDFEMRILFQMNANDSSSLIDTPDASKLTVHRAFLYDEGQGRLEKFRPYGLPSEDWLETVKKQLAR